MSDDDGVGDALHDALAGEALTEFAFGPGLILRFGTRGTEVRIGARFGLGRTGGAPRLLEPRDATDALLPLLDTELTRAGVAGGALGLTFTYSTLLSVPPSTVVEAWQLRAADGLLVVCRPGGEVSVWRPPEGVRAAVPRR